jgi:hypothetical protein
MTGFPLRRSGFDLRAGNLGFVADKELLGRVSSDYSGFLDNSHSKNSPTFIIIDVT